MPPIQKIRTLEKIAVGIRDLAIKKAPYKDGTLVNAIKKANTPAKTKMIKQLDDFSIELSLNYAPDEAPYGQWFNDPPAVKTKDKNGNKSPRPALRRTAKAKGNWNYAIDAMNDDELNQKFEAYLAEIGDYIIQEIEYEFNKP